eukprot:CAMPEP_0174298764 /NCGR_PEP_ID=MMETSP0809-20121228/54765_1 /TAXON_ID=73025 ORGANISM="Eutreptiella gymnastica-like, Strain CCMP1594" /NCGR_SAMPLE_ID=MMETSP0809 /ASSEMBLY_ACC=CAM_ASM_000658 /LENGTH=34 /DNA_ID= /DNA_START= /DNA_END= /DNA_ORIENTATION=
MTSAPTSVDRSASAPSALIAEELSEATAHLRWQY